MAIENKVALVTGAGQGIGRGIALRLAKEGASLMLVDVNPEGIAAVAAEVEALGRKAATFVANIAERDQVYAAIDRAEKELGGFDIIVNNAGIAQVQALADVTPEGLTILAEQATDCHMTYVERYHRFFCTYRSIYKACDTSSGRRLI